MTTAKHGTRACYVGNKCRQPECREANRLYREQHDRAKLYGRYDVFVDAAPVREHILALSLAGIGRRRLVVLSGISDTAIQTIKRGTPGKRDGAVPERVRRETAAKIMAVTVDSGVAAHSLVPARGTQRRVQALIARGWSQNRIAAQLGLSSDNTKALLTSSHVTRAKAESVAALYEELWRLNPPVDGVAEAAAARRAINRARRLRWAPPLAWDDIDTDETLPAVERDEHIDETAVLLAISGEPVKLTPPERREAVSRLHRERWSDQRIAVALHCADRTVLRIRQELGLEAFDFADLRQVDAA